MLRYLVVDTSSLPPLDCACCCSFLGSGFSGGFLVYSLADTQGHHSVARVGTSYHNEVDYHSFRHPMAHGCCLGIVAFGPVQLLLPGPVVHFSGPTGCIRNLTCYGPLTGTKHTAVCTRH